MFGGISLSLPLNCWPISALDLLRVNAEKLGEGAEVDDVLEELTLARILVASVRDRRQRHADDSDVAAKARRRHRARRIVEEVSARVDLGDILRPGLRVHRDHQVDAAAPADMPGLRNAHLVPGRQALDVRGENVARGDRHAHAQNGAREQPVRRCRSGAVDVREFHHEVVDATRARHRDGRHWRVHRRDPLISSTRSGPPRASCRAGISACPTRRSDSARRKDRSAGRGPRPWP